jgi:hypothetical protein
MSGNNWGAEDVKKQQDYIITMRLINDMLAKEDTGAGSIKLGKKYAQFYFDKINDMLSTREMNNDIYKELNEKVKIDLELIRADCKKRVQTQNSIDNNNMMSMIIDFILTLE